MISVIIPLYNAEKYIEWCLISFENQKYKAFEIIVVNDGSTDNSVNIVNDYIKRSQMKIKNIHQENAGVSAARNKGIDHAMGQYICFVDSDDMVVPEYLSAMVEILSNDVCDMVMCGVRSISEESNCNLYDSDKKAILKMSSHETLKKFLYRDINPGVGAFMVMRKVIDENQLRFAEGYRYSEDIEMIFKMIAQCNEIVCTRAQLYLYRVRNTSVMSLVDDKRLDGFKLMKGLEYCFDKLRPDFAEEFRKFGVSRWVWATLWQIAMASNNYTDFVSSADKYNARFHMRKLIKFPKTKVSTSALIYSISPFTYYNIIIKIIGIKKKRDFIKS